MADVLDELDDVPVLETTVPLREAIALAASTTDLVDPYPALWAELAAVVDALKSRTTRRKG